MSKAQRLLSEIIAGRLDDAFDVCYPGEYGASTSTKDSAELDIFCGYDMLE